MAEDQYDPDPVSLTVSQVNDAPKQQLNNVKVSLKNSELWQKFNVAGTEMIITKLGRRMFPWVLVDVTGLEPEARYFLILEVSPVSNSRYKFDSTTWVPSGKAEVQLPSGSRLFTHPDSPATGTHWMCQPVTFQKVKLTNNSMNRCGEVLLSSMQKYVLQIHVIKASDILQIQWSPTSTFTFPETEFIAVTAYQNEKVTKLKINYNKFAKGFRDTGKSNCKRKSLPKEDTGVVRKRSYSCSSLTADSVRSSLGSSSPLAGDLSIDHHEPVENQLVPYAQFDNYLPYPYCLCYTVPQLWRYLNQPNLFEHHLLPIFPCHPDILRQRLFPPDEQPHLIDLSQKTGKNSS